MKMEKKDIHPIVDAVIIVLIVIDTFMLLLITFYNIDPVIVFYVIYFDLFVCGVLFVEFLFRLRRKSNKKLYIIRHWYDIVAMIPLDFVAYNVFFLRVFRFVRFFRYIRLLRIIALARKSLKHFGEFIKDTNLHLSLGILIFTIFAGTIIFFLIEGDSNSSVQSLWDAFWYVMPTVATLGSEDIVPKTAAGRLVSMFMMLIGLIFFGMLTASIAYYYVEGMEREIQKESDTEIEKLRCLITNLQSEIQELKEIMKEKEK
jgi:voltage-gated potassium channel